LARLDLGTKTTRGGGGPLIWSEWADTEMMQAVVKEQGIFVTVLMSGAALKCGGEGETTR
jgi:hypothetical protein